MPYEIWSQFYGKLAYQFWQKTLQFINNDATSVHGCIRPYSIFFSESGEWKLGGFDALSSMKEDDAVLPVRKLYNVDVGDLHC